jgi:hypothetical protein
MAKSITTKFFEFDQNNSGGSFHIDDERGLGPRVWIEALDANDANARAEHLGIYFDGCSNGRDCPCCGDRWSAAWRDESGKREPEIRTGDGIFGGDFGWHDTVYVHNFDGTIRRVTKPAA